MLYFAYGSNMDEHRMKVRCPSAEFISVAVLRDYRIAFTWKCRAGHGVADVVPAEGSKVWGVVYRIDEIDLGKLDKCEGYRPQRTSGNTYRRVEVMVFSADADEQPVTCWTYEIVKKAGKHVPPSREYLDHIVQGATAWDLPRDYVEQIRNVEVNQ